MIRRVTRVLGLFLVLDTHVCCILRFRNDATSFTQGAAAIACFEDSHPSGSPLKRNNDEAPENKSSRRTINHLQHAARAERV